MLRDRLNTRNILRRKSRVLENYNCPLCNSSAEETVEHLSFSCSFSTWCWRFMNIQWDLRLSLMERIIQGRRDFRNKIFRELIMVACWALWTHRNEKMIFKEELSLVVHRTKPSLELELSSWLCNFH
ncbi:hypothetical protein HU200_051092 [Digitaria exilis]|uniref:Reverse transcriptase zinc-binding domain-containing protein n=1 Tax=Digitaria exilis TaxID=1010633 RepID=A0A835EAL4_9POAL|nr:hypothetical protein HU200_051092 [Digitaria exilis]